MTKQTDVPQFMSELDAGVFEEKLGRVLSEVASAVDTYDKKGKVTITLDLKKLGSAGRVNISHKLAYQIPTPKGDKSENDLTETPMHVNSGGSLSFFPENQSQMFDQHGSINEGVKA